MGFFKKLKERLFKSSSKIEEGLDATEIIAGGHDSTVVKDVLTRLARNEHKRWQMPPAPRVSKRAFGQGWRQPLAARHDWR